jgi:hypothetical protein
MNIHITKINPRDEFGRENPPEMWGAYLDRKRQSVREAMIKLGEDARAYMIGLIQAGYEGRGKREGSIGTLESSIQVEQPSPDVVGIGNINTMNERAKYWAIINWGGMVASKARRVPGFFDGNREPLGGFRGTGVGKEEFFYTPRGLKLFVYGGANKSPKTSMMIVRNPIGPVGYIEKTQSWLMDVAKVTFWNALKGSTATMK